MQLAYSKDWLRRALKLLALSSALFLSAVAFVLVSEREQVARLVLGSFFAALALMSLWISGRIVFLLRSGAPAAIGMISGVELNSLTRRKAARWEDIEKIAHVSVASNAGARRAIEINRRRGSALRIPTDMLSNSEHEVDLWIGDGQRRLAAKT